MDSISSEVKTREGCNLAAVFVDNSTGYPWIYGMKTKD
jgi:hypothetical protein